jgi:hypothetical protein
VKVAAADAQAAIRTAYKDPSMKTENGKIFLIYAAIWPV